jgi:hypothetical protein
MDNSSLGVIENGKDKKTDTERRPSMPLSP